MSKRLDSFGSRATLDVGGSKLDMYRLDALARAGISGVDTLPVSLRVLLENLLRNEDGKTVSRADIEAVATTEYPAPALRGGAHVEYPAPALRGGAHRDAKSARAAEIAYRPARVLLQDFTGVPVVVDLAAMREAFARMGGDPGRINPL